AAAPRPVALSRSVTGRGSPCAGKSKLAAGSTSVASRPPRPAGILIIRRPPSTLATTWLVPGGSTVRAATADRERQGHLVPWTSLATRYVRTGAGHTRRVPSGSTSTATRRTPPGVPLTARHRRCISGLG